jgi:hypothetical protein
MKSGDKIFSPLHIIATYFIWQESRIHIKDYEKMIKDGVRGIQRSWVKGVVDVYLRK